MANTGLSWFDSPVNSTIDNIKGGGPSSKKDNLKNILDPAGWYHDRTPTSFTPVDAPFTPGEPYVPVLLESGGEGDSGASMAQILEDYLTGNPQVAAQQYQINAQYLPYYSALLRSQVSNDRASNMNDVGRMLPQVQAIDQARQRPQANAMMNMLYNQIGSELAQGGNMTPAQSAAANESIRSGQLARGTISGAGAANREAVQRAIQSMDLLTARQGKAQNLINFDQTLKTNPYTAILGGPTTTNAAVGLTGQTANTLTPGMYIQHQANVNQNNLATAQFNAQQQNQANILNMMKSNQDYAGIAGF